jgi:hypothetical protein
MWQPIEIVPLDGTEVLLSDGVDVCLGSIQNHTPNFRDLGIHLPDGARFESDCRFKPTLWAPVPPLPPKP